MPKARRSATASLIPSGSWRGCWAGCFSRSRHKIPALFAPPLPWPRWAFDWWERAGGAVIPQFPGVTIAEASKDVHGVVPLRRSLSGRRVLADITGF